MSGWIFETVDVVICRLIIIPTLMFQSEGLRVVSSADAWMHHIRTGVFK